MREKKISTKGFLDQLVAQIEHPSFPLSSNLGSAVHGGHEAGKSSTGTELEDILAKRVLGMGVHPVGKHFGGVPEMVSPERMGSDEAQFNLLRDLVLDVSGEDFECGFWGWGSELAREREHVAEFTLRV